MSYSCQVTNATFLITLKCFLRKISQHRLPCETVWAAGCWEANPGKRTLLGMVNRGEQAYLDQLTITQMFTSLPQSSPLRKKSDWGGYRDGSVRKVPVIQALCLNFWNAYQMPGMCWVPVTSALSGLVAIRQVDSCSPLASQPNQ